MRERERERDASSLQYETAGVSVYEEMVRDYNYVCEYEYFYSVGEK